MKQHKKAGIDKTLGLILTLIFIVILLVVLLPVITGQSGIRGAISKLFDAGEGFLEALTPYERQTPDHVRQQEEAQLVEDHFTRIEEGSVECSRYIEILNTLKEANLAPPEDSQAPKKWRVCYQNTEGNRITTDQNRYCAEWTDKPKREIEYFKRYISCTVQPPFEENCDLARQEADRIIMPYIATRKDPSTGRNVLPPSAEDYAQYSPHSVYITIAKCYERVATETSQQKAQQAYKIFSEYAAIEGMNTNPADKAQSDNAQAQLVAQTEEWKRLLEVLEEDPQQTLAQAIGRFNGANTEQDYRAAHREFDQLVRKLDPYAFGPESRFGGSEDGQIAPTSQILRTLIANAYYYRGKAQYFADKQLGTLSPSDICFNQAREFGLATQREQRRAPTESEARTFVGQAATGFNQAREFVLATLREQRRAPTESEARTFVGQAATGGPLTEVIIVTEFGYTLKNELFVPSSQHRGQAVMPKALYETAECYQTEAVQPQQAHSYFKALFDNFEEDDHSLIRGINLLKPNCQESIVSGNPSACNSVNQEYFEQSPISTKQSIRSQLRCFWNGGNRLTDGLFGSGTCSSCTIIEPQCAQYINGATCDANPCGFVPDCNAPFLARVCRTDD